MKSKLNLGIILFFVIFSSLEASILGFDQYEIDFRVDSSLTGLTYSDNFQLTESNLVYANPGNEYAWIKTAVYPVGLAFRPPRSVSLNLDIQGQIPDSIYCYVYYRYSADKVHWSEWVNLPPEDSARQDFLRSNSFQIIRPRNVDLQYQRLMEEWRKTGPVWICDEDALCRWIALHNPEYFSWEIPFIGFVQFYIEFPYLYEKISIEKINTSAMWGVSGLTTLPTDGSEGDTYSSWHFDLNEY
ncbi:MAG: hypothetical protein APR63_03435 [Desulfuromonas sp. SDB]|nr:MAG: hypothetical protein APR63_03435 [Desulfuromonas sp. SDB]